MNGRWGLVIGGFLGATGVAAGAFGAHALRGSIGARELEIWQTAAHYQQVHAVAILAAAAWASQELRPLRRVALWLLTLGVLLFSGTLYPLALGGPKILGAVTPLGGLCLIGGWATLAVEGLRSRG
ncbi:MAG: DUF423 domain-containing protein [Nannocystaceae bacterium]